MTVQSRPSIDVNTQTLTHCIALKFRRLWYLSSHREALPEPRAVACDAGQAPSEAEAQCAAMCKDELVYAMASEDMDSLTFGTPRLTRNLMKPANAKVAVNEYEYQKVRALGVAFGSG